MFYRFEQFPCNANGFQSKYTCVRSLVQHLKNKHVWFWERYWRDNNSTSEMGGESEGEGDNLHNMRVNYNVFFGLKVFSIVMKIRNIRSLMKFLQLLIFESYLQLFIGVINTYT